MKMFTTGIPIMQATAIYSCTFTYLKRGHFRPVGHLCVSELHNSRTSHMSRSLDEKKIEMCLFSYLYF